MEMEQIFAGIYLTLCEDKWTTDKLRTHGFTHIIRIDKHIRTNQNTSTDRNHVASSVVKSAAAAAHSPLDRDHLSPHLDGFETLDLNFGETSYLTTVLPNCYKGVRFIDSALKNGGRVLIVDRITNEKCITVVVGFLMYKDNLKFSYSSDEEKQEFVYLLATLYVKGQIEIQMNNWSVGGGSVSRVTPHLRVTVNNIKRPSTAFQLVKQIHPNIELDRYYVNQMYEYEPILQVQRTLNLYGTSCSRELRSSMHKRKVSDDMTSAIPTCDDKWNSLSFDSSDTIME